ncbi:CBS domain-containing protein [Desulfonatronum thioautotrophicum]|uniref:CBS domain-containing protein n=1 Tax=Desulfonatronum thioautotrophicum TaxID=617001 RepID=UPI0005EBCD33|nr:CBS domain-containing protein [Desulfonatronum thioautotrophicum]
MVVVEKTVVRDFMRPVGDFPRISRDATFGAAVAALDKAQEDFVAGRAKQRILLVEDEQGRIVGKLSPMDVMQGLEPGYVRMMNTENLRYRDVDYVVRTMREQTRLWAKPFDDLCKTAQDVQVKEFLRTPSESTLIQVDDSLDAAFHRFVVGRHDSLFVKHGKDLVGLLRFSDVYREVSRRINDVCVTK